MYGVGLNMLWEPDIYQLMKVNAERKKTSIKILIADVDSPSIEQRHDEESNCKLIVPKGKEFSKNVLSSIQELEAQINNKDMFSVSTFSHYPTFALLIIDSDIYIYQYGFQTVGTLSPVTHLCGSHSPQVKYYREQLPCWNQYT